VYGNFGKDNPHFMPLSTGTLLDYSTTSLKISSIAKVANLSLFGAAVGLLSIFLFPAAIER